MLRHKDTDIFYILYKFSNISRSDYRDYIELKVL